MLYLWAEIACTMYINKHTLQLKVLDVRQCLWNFQHIIFGISNLSLIQELWLDFSSLSGQLQFTLYFRSGAPQRQQKRIGSAFLWLICRPLCCLLLRSNLIIFIITQPIDHAAPANEMRRRKREKEKEGVLSIYYIERETPRGKLELISLSSCNSHGDFLYSCWQIVLKINLAPAHVSLSPDGGARSRCTCAGEKSPLAAHSLF